MKTVLVIDDNHDFSEMISFVLKEEGYNVVTAFNGKEGALQVHRQRPDLILMDVMMPDRDGKETAEYLNAMKKFTDIPVIFVTGVVSPDEREGGDTIKIDGRTYPKISKPVSREDLIRRVKEVLPL